ncbi:TonB-dependent receptor [Novosphingobium sp. Fuku2-ISO-50]|uniref:TonB-dependent receptor n=1 Tax=Novosphingobium sp. Fuku2-ISO-50 TaxID=1739114 RepID=UPI0009E7EA20|nr:TonB-dependent receptor [Novosphingobium sp. Fuku2-ISO-50]
MSNNKHRKPLWRAMLLAGIASVTWSHKAFAEEQPQPNPNASAPAHSTVETITVTARKREEKLQETPISISAFSAKGLESRNITQIDQIAQSVPNLTIKSSVSTSGNNTSASFFIRGIGQSDFLLNVDPGVGLYVDGVYVPRSIGGLLDLLDPERIEVLRGPQGTLFGRNTIGGAISITSQKPSSTWTGYGQVTTGSYNRLDFSARVSGPIAENLLVAVSAERLKEDGYVKNMLPGGPDEGGRNSWSMRGQLSYTPTDRLSIDLAADYTQQRDETSPNVLIAVNPNALLVSSYNAKVGGTCVTAAASSNPACFSSYYVAGPYRTYSTYLTSNPVSEAFAQSVLGAPFAPQSNADIYGVSGTIGYDFGAAKLKSITAFRSVNAVYPRDTDHSPLQVEQVLNRFIDKEFTQELQLSGKGFDDRLKWLIGAFYDHETGTHRDFLDVDLFVALSGGSVKNDSVAVYTQETYEITSKLSLTAGVRWTDDTKRFTPDQYIVQDLGLGIPAGTPLLPNTQVETTAREWTPYVNLSYKWTPDVMTYASYSKGYKGGGFTQRVFPPLPATPSFAPETANVYEVGFKSAAFGHRLQVNGAAFYTDYKNLQVNTLAGIAPITENAAAATIKGFELEAQATPVDGLHLEASTGYLDAAYKHLDQAAIDAGLALGNKLVDTPKWTYALSASYDMQFKWGTISPRIDWSYRSSVENDALNHILLHQDGYGILNLALTYHSPDKLWTVSAGGQNVLNKAYIESGFWDMPVTGIVEAAYGRPSEWYLKIKRKF